MVVIAAGVPCAWTAWAFEALKLVAAARGGEVQLRYFDRLDECAAEDEQHAVILTQYPNPSIGALAQTRDLRFLLFRETCNRSVAHLMGAGGTGYLEALRAVGASCSLIKGLTRARKPIDVPRIAPDHALDLLKWFGRVVGFAIPEDRAASILRTLGNPPAPSEVGDETLDDSQRETARLVLNALYEGLAQPALPRLTWPYNVFFSGDRPNTSADSVTDVTGAARILYYGPYFHLPAGTWQARATLGFSDDVADTPFALEAHSTNVLGGLAFKPRSPGLFTVTMRFDVTSPEQPIEVRLRSERGAIEGQIALVKLDFEPLEEHHGEQVQPFEAS